MMDYSCVAVFFYHFGLDRIKVLLFTTLVGLLNEHHDIENSEKCIHIKQIEPFC